MSVQLLVRAEMRPALAWPSLPREPRWWTRGWNAHSPEARVIDVMSYAALAGLVALALFVGMLLVMELGRRIALRRKALDPKGALSGTGAVDGAVFALLGLLVAFTFSGAGSRLDARRALIVEETNAIGTAYLRIDLLPETAQPPLRDLFRQYVDSRIRVYRALPDVDAATAELARSAKLQRDIWQAAVSAGQTEGVPTTASMLLLPALNQMIDITATRAMATQVHPPAIVFVMLFALALVASLLAGYGMAGRRQRSYIHMIGFAAVTATVVYVIADLEYPRLGLIRVEAFDRALLELRSSMQ